MLQQHNIQRSLNGLTLEDVGNKQLIATGSKNTINLLLQYIEIIQRAKEQMAFETQESSFESVAPKGWDITIERKSEHSVQLTGAWQALNNIFKTHGLTVQPARTTMANLAYTS